MTEQQKQYLKADMEASGMFICPYCKESIVSLPGNLLTFVDQNQGFAHNACIEKAARKVPHEL